jgi:hypothetical protein
MNKLMVISLLSGSLLAGACMDEPSSSVTRIDADLLDGVSLLQLELVDGDLYEFDSSRGAVHWERIAFVDGDRSADATALQDATASLGGRFEVRVEIEDELWRLHLESVVPEGAIALGECLELTSITTNHYDWHGNDLWRITPWLTTWFCSAST